MQWMNYLTNEIECLWFIPMPWGGTSSFGRQAKSEIETTNNIFFTKKGDFMFINYCALHALNYDNMTKTHLFYGNVYRICMINSVWQIGLSLCLHRATNQSITKLKRPFREQNLWELELSRAAGAEGKWRVLVGSQTSHSFPAIVE